MCNLVQSIYINVYKCSLEGHYYNDDTIISHSNVPHLFIKQVQQFMHMCYEEGQSKAINIHIACDFIPNSSLYNISHFPTFLQTCCSIIPEKCVCKFIFFTDLPYNLVKLPIIMVISLLKDLLISENFVCFLDFFISPGS